MVGAVIIFYFSHVIYRFWVMPNPPLGNPEVSQRPPKRIALQFALQRIAGNEDAVQDNDPQHASENEASDSEGSDDSTSNSSESSDDADSHNNASIYEEESDGEMFEEVETSDSSSEDENYEVGAEQPADEQGDGNILAPNGKVWRKDVPPVRRLARNIIAFHPGTHLHPPTESDAFCVFITETILRTIMRHTNTRLRALKKKTFTYAEIKAGVAIVLRAGADHNNMLSVDSFYDAADSKPFYR
jgi:hypothetical protein